MPWIDRLHLLEDLALLTELEALGIDPPPT
jgi:hypothetical protein